jgi:AcrR family transcriptional regulator
MPAVSRVRGEYAKTAGRRAEILDAAVRDFAEAGFRGGTLRSIAERVGISQPGLLHHFASKEKLLEAVLDHRDDLARARMGEPLPTGVALLRALIDLVDFNATTPGLVALYAVLSGEGTSPDNPGHEYFRGRYTFVRALVEDAIRLGQQQGDLRADVKADMAARTVIALMDGLQLQWLFEDSSFDLAAPVRAYVESLLIAGSL